MTKIVPVQFWDILLPIMGTHTHRVQAAENRGLEKRYLADTVVMVREAEAAASQCI